MSCEDNYDEYFKYEKETLCFNIAFHRVDKQMTLTQLSEKTGIPKIEVEAYEIGTCEFEFEKICKIGFALGLSLCEIVGH